MVGQTISHYKILEKLGGGGMGIVYKAEDTKLKRTVALKFLPPELTRDDEAKQRFIHEAQAASALQHNNICVVYDIDESDDGQMFISMECLEGETLKKKIERGQLKTEEATDIAMQIALGLSEAHGHSIVHRDVKPANILITKSGVAKIVDFGLAKLSGASKLTKTGSTLGTVAYMSPEQLQGRDVDARADIFSLGVVLYEMLAGKMPFRGDHEAALMYSILNEEPAPLQQYVAHIPSELIHIVSRALEKSPADRYKTMDDLLIDLRRLRRETSKVSLPTFRQIAQQGFTWKHAALIGLCVILTGALVTVFILPSFRKMPQLNPGMTFRTLQIPFRNVWGAGVSEDGNWLVIPAEDDRGRFDVYMMNTFQGQPRRVTNDSCNGIMNVSISPDGSTILYTREPLPGQPMARLEHEVVSVPSLGGKGRVIIEKAFFAAWQPGGTRIAYIVGLDVGSGRRTIGFWTAMPDGSDRRCEFVDTIAVRVSTRYAWSWSPDRNSIAWTRNYIGGYTEIIIRDLETGKERQLTFDKKFADDPVWTWNEHIVFSSNRGGNVNLWVVPSSGGEPVQLTRGSGPDSPLWISPDCRRMIYSEIQDLGHIKLGDLRNGSVRQLTVDERFRYSPAISSTGAFVAFAAKEENEYSVRTDIYVMDRQGSETRKLTDGPEFKSNPSWSHDEKWITYSAQLPADPPDSSRIYLINVENPSQPRSIGKGFAASWFNEKEFIVRTLTRSYRGSIDRPDLVRIAEDSVRVLPILNGKYIYVYDNRAGRQGAWITTAQSYESYSLKEAKLLVRAPFFGAIARDGRDLIYFKPGGTHDLRRISLPDGKEERINGAFPGLESAFSVRQDGKEIAYIESYRKTRFVIIENLFK
jgi:serine/threonine protein kinase